MASYSERVEARKKAGKLHAVEADLGEKDSILYSAETSQENEPPQNPSGVCLRNLEKSGF